MLACGLFMVTSGEKEKTFLGMIRYMEGNKKAHSGEYKNRAKMTPFGEPDITLGE